MILDLLMICHGSTKAWRRAHFPADEPLDRQGLAGAGEAAAAMPFVRPALTSPARSARQTAAALGLAALPDDSLADCDYGRWSGQALADVAAVEPEAVAAWLARPDAAPHGGESLLALIDRTAAWLTARTERRLVAVTHPAVLRAALVHVLGAPAAAFWRIDVAPLSTVELRSDGRRWQLRSLAHPPPAAGKRRR